MEDMKQPLLKIENLTVAFRMYEKGFQKKEIEVVRGIDLTLHKGEILAVVGVSGAGKSILAHAVLGILPRNAKVSGEMYYRGKSFGQGEKEHLRGREIAYIPQSVDSLDPLMRVGRQVQGIRGTKKQQRELFKRYRLAPSVERQYPFQLSGGMARRILLAAAEMEDVRLVVADEPTPGLDVQLSQETMGHFRRMAERGCSVLLITHDVELALAVADRVAVFAGGTVAETISVGEYRKRMERIHIHARERKQDGGIFQRLEARNLSFRYSGNLKGQEPWIFKDLNLSIGPGERVALVGPSGCGKSTLAKVLAGYEKPECGEVLWGGEPLPERGYCPVQMLYQHPELAVNPRWKMGKILRESWTPDEETLRVMGIKKEWMDRWPSELSGGELQRFCITRVLDPRTRFLICDEISTMLDKETEAHVWTRLLEVAEERGIGMLVITHDMKLAQKVCTRRIEF